MSVTTRTNLATNPTAASTTGYAAVAGTGGTAALTNQTTAGYSGASFNRVTWSVATTALSGGASYTCTGLAATTQYAASVWVRSSVAQTVTLTVAFQNSTPATVNTVTSASTALAANTWTRVSVTGTSGAAVVQAVLTVAATTGGALWANGNTLDIDAVLVEASATVGGYYDGTFTNAGGVVYVWTGTANASTSTATTYTPALSLATGYSPCPNVQVTITDLPPSANTVTVWRTADGARAAVRTTQGLTVTSSTAVNDWEAPQGRDVAYDLEVTAGVGRGTIAPTQHVTLTARTDTAGKPTWWIQDPLVPGTAIELAVTRGDGSRPYLTAAAVKALEYASDVSIVPIIGSDLPLAIGGQRLAAAGVDFSMFTATAQATTNLRNLLRSSSTLLVRPPGTGREAGLPGLVYTAVAKPAEQPVTVAFGGSLTRWSIAGDTVAPPTAAILVPVWTYQAVNALWSTYQQAQTALAAKTYLDVLKSPSGA